MELEFIQINDTCIQVKRQDSMIVGHIFLSKEYLLNFYPISDGSGWSTKMLDEVSNHIDILNGKKEEDIFKKE